MNLNKQMELASAIFGSEPTTGLERVTATATADSADGEVTVQFEDGSTLAVPVTGAVKNGDEVIVNVQQGTPIAAGAAGWGDRVQTIADSAAAAAADAQAVAEATGQHFWHRSTDPNGDGAGTGAFITDEEQDDFLTAAAAGFPDYDPDTKPYANMLLNSLGVLIRNALNTFASFTKSAVSFFDGSGNVTASFGSTAVIGKNEEGATRAEIDASGLKLFYKYQGNDFLYCDLGVNASGDGYYALGYRDGTAGYQSVVLGSGEASGSYTVAQNLGTVAASHFQTAMGQFNVADTNGDYALIIGNGTADNARSNALTVKWDGTVQDGAGNVIAPYKVTRFVPSTTTTGTLSTSADKVWYIDSATVNTAGVTTDGQGTYTIPEAGTWRIKLHCGMYPNTTAKTRLCCGIYMSSITGTRLALGVQQMYNATANSATQVVCVDCEYIGTFSASDKVVIGAFADVTNAKIYRPSGDLTCVTFEKVG